MNSVAIVGLGKIATDQHLPAIEASDGFRLAAVVSPEGRGAPGVPTFASQTAMLKALPDLDAISICTPPSARYDLAREALAAGRHVLLEKPPAVSLSEIEDLKAFAAAANLTLFATWHARFNPAVVRLRELLAQRALVSVTTIWKEDVRRWHPGQDWIFAAGGFGVFDPGINALSILSAILPFPLFVRHARLQVPANRDAPIAAELDLGAPPGTLVERMAAVFDFRQEGEQTWTIDIVAKDGERLSLTHGGTQLWCDGRRVVDDEDREYSSIYSSFSDLIARRASDVDVTPLRLVADAFVAGRHIVTEPFSW